jgi:hypothetical protein
MNVTVLALLCLFSFVVVDAGCPFLSRQRQAGGEAVLEDEDADVVFVDATQAVKGTRRHLAEWAKESAELPVQALADTVATLMLVYKRSLKAMKEYMPLTLRSRQLLVLIRSCAGLHAYASGDLTRAKLLFERAQREGADVAEYNVETFNDDVDLAPLVVPLALRYLDIIEKQEENN